VEGTEKSYTTKEISLTLDIGTSTLRKWCIALEENGYIFLRNLQNGRSFLERDIVALKHFGHLVKKENFTLENAGKIVASKYQGEATQSRTPAVLQEVETKERDFERSDELINMLKKYIEIQNEHIKRQENFNEKLVERLERQQNYIDERLNERDQLLLTSIQNIKEEKKSSWWSNLFKK
jgi:DNA-binding transcriptional MerR regulator